jgi:succinyl-CoA:acetate CoA-transferase
MNVGTSGFTPAGYPKMTTIALAKQIKEGKKCRINLWTGASVGKEIEEELAAVNAIASRIPYYAFSNRSMQKGINAQAIDYLDLHLSHFGQQVNYGFWGDVDVCIIEAVAITEEGHIILGPGVGNTPILAKLAKKIIVEVNTTQPLEFEGMHDIYIQDKPPNRKEIPAYHVTDRVGTTYLECGIDRIDCIVESNIPDQVRDLEQPDEKSIKIAENLIDFLKTEQKRGLLPKKMLPLQSGVWAVLLMQYWEVSRILITKTWKCTQKFFKTQSLT